MKIFEEKNGDVDSRAWCEIETNKKYDLWKIKTKQQKKQNLTRR